MDSFSEPIDDPILEEMLASLKRLEPPLESRIANRMAIAAELSSLRMGNRPRYLPWWRRSISIPAPIAACLLVLGAYLLQARFHGGQQRLPVDFAAPMLPVERAADVQAVTAKHPSDAHAKLEYFATETYLCGIGRLKSESGYFIKD